MKTGLIINNDQKKEFTDGKWEGAKIFYITLDNGDEGEIFVPRGQAVPTGTINYNLQETEYGNKIKIVKDQKGGGGFGKADPAKSASIERQVALKEAVTFLGYFIAKGEKVTKVDVCNVADYFDDWLKKKPAKEVPKVTELQQAPPPSSNDELPF